jgi:endonuclease/exonuclease/phosphatase (EEP) superfamily protein YafD
MFILVLMPSLIWLLLKPIHSPWWLENTLSNPIFIVVIYSVLMLALIHFVSYLHCAAYFLINFFLAVLLNSIGTFNGISSLNKITSLNKKACTEPITFFQFNIKYTEKEEQLNELVEHLIAGKYHLITLQGVSQQTKQQLVENLSPYYPYFIRGESEHQTVVSDQLLFSQYAFSNSKYYNRSGSAFLISSQWQLPLNEINLYSLHPPSPRNEKLWQSRNKTLYQLKYALNNSPVKNSLVIGDLNISRHSSRIKLLKQTMNTAFVNSWPKNSYTLPFMGLAIDHLWVSKPANICARQRISQFSWSDHYALKTQIDFKK